MPVKLFGGALIVALVVILLMSPRDWVLSDQRRAVADVAALPEGSGKVLSNLEYLVGQYGVHVPHTPTKAQQLYQILVLAGRVPPARLASSYQRPRFGYSIREWSFLGMPFGWYSEYGFVLYSNDRRELVETPLIEAGNEQLMQEVGRDLRQGFFFPFWAHAWGWLFVAAVGLWGWLYHRSVVRQREELGLI
ncbi:hypothetical protein MZO42_14680 [Sphingomonas psychrotolerans]|uniref:DUF2939 domain-containing protein n=1 Tax=Sphingomonas psychrotolerans TaxID=1327635 RepID=A0ABU3N5Z0_9SPHN|nr:hypothetical protein [Sphingomonas psychrotolerans]MDT8759945.1 hypothetical protein [Sphingomonas psychrotolerans]